MTPTYIIAKRYDDRSSESLIYSSVGEAESLEAANAIASSNACKARYRDILIVVHVDNIHSMIDNSESAYFIDKKGAAIKVASKEENWLKFWDGSKSDANTMLMSASECMDYKTIGMAACACARTIMREITDKKTFALSERVLIATEDYCSGRHTKARMMRAVEAFVSRYKELHKPSYLAPIASAVSMGYELRSFAPSKPSCASTPFKIYVHALSKGTDEDVLGDLAHTVRRVISASDFLEAMWEKAIERIR